MSEFLLANKNGSYSNMSLWGETERVFGGYLVASLTPPQDRAVVLENVKEYIFDGPAEKFEDAVKTPVYGFQDLPGVCSPRYTEENYFAQAKIVSDVVSIERTVCLDRKGSDTVFVDYVVTNKRNHKITFEAEPEITFRPPDRAINPKNLVFEECECSFADKEFAYKRAFVPKTGFYEEIPCRIFLYAKKEGNMIIEPVNDFRDGYTYPLDDKTGFHDKGASYIPDKFCFTIPEKKTVRFRLYCGVAGLSEDSCKEDIRNFLEISDKELTAVNSFEWKSAMEVSKCSEVIPFFVNRNLPYLAAIYHSMVVSADKFVSKKAGMPFYTILAGFPWFYDWGRDTMISIPGILLTTGQFDRARDVLAAFCKYEKNGLLPNVFRGMSKEKPQYNTVDASLWFFYAADMYVKYSGDREFVTKEMLPVLRRIIKLYSRSKEEMLKASAEEFCYGIYMDREGLVHAGTDDSDQLTWMDVRIDGKAVTPRHGSPVEIQALMYNAVNVMLTYDPDNRTFYMELKERIEASSKLYINAKKHCLYDYIEGEPGERSFNEQIRPNQIFAVSLPYCMYGEEVCEDILNTVREKLVTDIGIRSLEPEDPGYIAKFEGELLSRDRAYHNGTSWGFLTGHYLMAWLKAFGEKEDALKYFNDFLKETCIHIVVEGCINGFAEVFDGESPKEGKGCYNQAWSVGCMLEALRALYESRKEKK